MPKHQANSVKAPKAWLYANLTCTATDNASNMQEAQQAYYAHNSVHNLQFSQILICHDWRSVFVILTAGAKVQMQSAGEVGLCAQGHLCMTVGSVAVPPVRSPAPGGAGHSAADNINKHLGINWHHHHRHRYQPFLARLLHSIFVCWLLQNAARWEKSAVLNKIAPQTRPLILRKLYWSGMLAWSANKLVEMCSCRKVTVS